MMKSSISIFTLVLIISTTATTTTTGFQLGLTAKVVNDNLTTRCCSTKKKTPSTPLLAVSSSSSSSNGRIRKLFLFGERTPSIRYKPSATTTQVVQATTHHHINKDSHQVVKKTCNNKCNSIAPLVTVTPLCLLSIILRRPNIAHATTNIIPPSPLSSIGPSLIDPAILTSSTTEGMTALNSNNINILNHNNKMKSLLLTALATIQMKQQSMIMFALAVGMTMVLLKCSQGGYVKFVEFVTNKCLGYYGLNNGEKKEEKVGWNDYVLHYLPRQSRVVAENNNSDKEIIVLDGKTMLFHQHSAKKKVARDDDMMERANQFYRKKQYEQHHHLLQDKATAATSTAAASSSSTFTNDVNKTPSWDKYKTTLHKLTQTQVDHDETSNKLQIMKNLVTWEDYKHLVTELQRKKVECSKLQEKVDSLTSLLEVERTVNQSSYDRTAVPPAVVGEDDNSEEEYDEELMSLVDKAKEYDETILQEESKMNHHGDSIRWH